MAQEENILIEGFLEARRVLELDTIKKLDKSLEFYRNLLVNLIIISVYFHISGLQQYISC